MPLPAMPLGRSTDEPAPESTQDRPRPSAPARRPRLYVLDGLRLVAALSVMCFHYVGKPAGWEKVWRGAPDELLPGLHGPAIYGWLGVDLFFLISGFVICMSCWGKRPRDFFISRVVRLYPAYWAAVALTSAVVLAAGYSFSTAHALTPRVVLANLTMLQAPLGAQAVDPSYWTLWVEMLFYIVFAVVVAFGLTYRRAVVFCVLWTLAGVLAPVAGLPLLSTLAQASYSPYFVAGIAMYLMYRFGQSFLLWGIVVFSWLLAQYQLSGTIRVYQQWLPQHLSWTVAVAIMTLCFGLVLAAALGLFDRITWKWLTTAGALTYPLYLIHQEIGITMIHWLRGHLAPAPTLAVVVATVLIAAWLLHRIVEKPLSGLLKRRLTTAFDRLTEADAAAFGGARRGE
ncbi:acyltransferase family protein [Kitasatospora paranensis]|uniref:Acyltransferase family protein n=2 Tax=Kitasatospora paranensis TaxID=258053 RepID=A0ABW2FVT7_9ACTN